MLHVQISFTNKVTVSVLSMNNDYLFKICTMTAWLWSIIHYKISTLNANIWCEELVTQNRIFVYHVPTRVLHTAITPLNTVFCLRKRGYTLMVFGVLVVFSYTVAWLFLFRVIIQIVVIDLYTIWQAKLYIYICYIYKGEHFQLLWMLIKTLVEVY